MKRIIAIATVLLIWSAITSHAMTGVEFLSVKGATEKRQMLEPITIGFVSQGYKNVPSWASLASAMESLIRKNGYANNDVDSIALEAAMADGMTR